MRQKELPPNLRKRLFQYYDFKYQKKYLNEELITGLLSGKFTWCLLYNTRFKQKKKWVQQTV